MIIMSTLSLSPWHGSAHSMHVQVTVLVEQEMQWFDSVAALNMFAVKQMKLIHMKKILCNSECSSVRLFVAIAQTQAFSWRLFVLSTLSLNSFYTIY